MSPLVRMGATQPAISLYNENMLNVQQSENVAGHTFCLDVFLSDCCFCFLVDVFAFTCGVRSLAEELASAPWDTFVQLST